MLVLRALLAPLLALLCLPSIAVAGQLLYSTEGNRLRRIDLDSVGGPLLQDVWKDRASDGGRDLNGQICQLPDGSGRLVMGEDSDQPHPAAGWGVFDPDGEQVGRLNATYQPGNSPEPFGCAIDREGHLFTTDIGNQVSGPCSGQLTLWFPPFDRFPGPPGAFPDTEEPSDHFCKLATDLCTSGTVALDEQGRVYVTQTRPGSGGSVLRFSPPFPTGPDEAGGCGQLDATGAPVADTVNREVFINDPSNLVTPSGLARSPAGGWYVANVLTGVIAEYDAAGAFLRRVYEPPPGDGPFDLSTGHPQGIAVDARGDLYFADLQLVQRPNGSIGPGPDGKVRRLPFTASGDPLPSEILLSGLAFPDGVSVLSGDLEPSEWRTYARGPERRFFNPTETRIKPANVDRLETKWSFLTGGAVTASPIVARVDVPGEGVIPVAYIQAWDRVIYAVRVSDGSELWRFQTEEQPGASFPNAASAHVENVAGQDLVFIGSGEIMYALDAVTGSLAWRFVAGTDCQVSGLCSFSGERNQIESSPIVADGQLIFGMDVNDVAGGKGGILALDVLDGRMRWFFDLETGSTCRPLLSDDVRRFDGHSSESDLGLPAGFLATRPGCDFDRTGTGCGNVWSSPAYDAARGWLYFASSNCDTDDDPATLLPPPPMPPYDEAIFALDTAGSPQWVWRPREVDNDDLAFGGVPNLFQIRLDDGRRVDVVGVGNKDGTYYTLDRDGVNQRTGVRWDDSDPSGLPYWSTNVVPGGPLGGILATAAVDEDAGRIYFSTAAGFSVFDPQRPTVHALDAHTGGVLWQNTAEANADAAFASTSGVPGLVFTGSALGSLLRGYDATSGDRLLSAAVAPGGVFGLASGSATVDGLVLVGSGIGTRNGDPSSQSEITADTPSPLTALGLPACGNGALDAGEVCDDGGFASGDGCSDLCAVEATFVCQGEPSVCVPTGAQSPDQRRCLTVAHAKLAGLARAHHLDLFLCARDLSKGKLASASTCVDDDAPGKVQKATGVLDAKLAKKCLAAPEQAPLYALRDRAIATASLASQSRAIASDLFGADLDGVLPLLADARDQALCQRELLKWTTKVSDVLWKQARKAMKRGLVGRQRLTGSTPVETGAELALEVEAALSQDPTGAVGRLLGKLALRVGKRCGPPVDLAASFPGRCATGSTADLVTCGEQVGKCRFCESLRRSAGLPLACDAFDDGSENESCP